MLGSITNRCSRRSPRFFLESSSRGGQPRHERGAEIAPRNTHAKLKNINSQVFPAVWICQPLATLNRRRNSFLQVQQSALQDKNAQFFSSIYLFLIFIHIHFFGQYQPTQQIVALPAKALNYFSLASYGKGGHLNEAKTRKPTQIERCTFAIEAVHVTHSVFHSLLSHKPAIQMLAVQFEPRVPRLLDQWSRPNTCEYFQHEMFSFILCSLQTSVSALLSCFISFCLHV